MIIVALWASLSPIFSILSVVFSQVLFVAILLEGGYVVASIILTVGLFELVLRDWSLVQTGLGFIIALIVVCLTYAIVYG